MNVKKKTTIEKISESRKSTLYSISFEKDGTTEFEKFVAEFEKNAKFNKDYQRIIAARICKNRGERTQWHRLCCF